MSQMPGEQNSNKIQGGVGWAEELESPRLLPEITVRIYELWERGRILVSGLAHPELSSNEMT